MPTKRFLLFALAFGFSLVMSGGVLHLSAADQTGAPDSSVALDEQTLAAATALYEEKCALCHEADGRSDNLRLNLADDQWLHGATLDDVIKTISEGVPGTLMKPMADKLTGEEIHAVARYVKSLSPDQPGEESAAAAETQEAAPTEGEAVEPDQPAPAEAGDSQNEDFAEEPSEPAPVAEAPNLDGLRALRIMPETPTLWGADARQRFVALGAFVDGLERDLTTLCQWTSSQPDLAAIEAGRVQARADGEFELAARIGDVSASTRVKIEGSQERLPFSFQRDVGGLLTRQGCNSTDCHGGVKGKGGLKLSLNALFPKDDYKWLVEGGKYEVLTAEQTEELVPRIDKENPAQSLLLLKPTDMVTHGGGKRFELGSPDYEKILKWIQDGAPYGEESGESAVRIEGIEIFPRQTVLQSEGRRQLLVTARLSNGRREDVTDQVIFASNNEVVAQVDSSGVVQAGLTGETSVMVRAAGHAATARVGVIGETIPDYPDVETRNFIDERVFAKLRKFNILPSPLSGDAEFLRRVCLDVAGTLPPPALVREFLADPDPDKRDKLIDTLLELDEYVTFWAYRFADLFRVHFSAQQNLKKTHQYMEWVRNRVAQNVPYDQVAREHIAAQGYAGTTQHYYQLVEMLEPHEMMAEVVRGFQGVRLECAECHNHPFEAWSQDQFWGLTAFFGKITHVQQHGLMVDFPEGLGGRHGGASITHPRTKAEVSPTFLDGAEAGADQLMDLRMELARRLTSPDDPFFARATVNRIWGAFFHRGIVDPVDDFRSTNPPSHPDLLDALAQDFVAHGFDIKHLIRTIVQSRTYQLTSEANATNEDDEINYSRFRPRLLDAVVHLDAISRATGVDEVFEMDRFVGGGPYAKGTRAIELLADVTPHRFLDVAGRPNRQALPEKLEKPTLAQALHRQAGSIYNEKIGREGGRVDRLVKSDAGDQAIIEELYLASLCRFPTETERAALEKLIAESPTRREGVEVLTWALIGSREFAYNH